MLIGYARVSTKHQDTTLQVEALKEAGCGKIFQERACGADRGRPQFTAALDYLRAGETLVVWKLDRLARSMTQLVETMERLRRESIEFRSLTEGIDTSTPGGKLVFHIFGAIAEFERDMIRERTMAGLAAARARGQIGGRPRSLDTAAMKTIVGRLADGNTSVRAIAREFGVAPATVYRHLPHARSDLVQMD